MSFQFLIDNNMGSCDATLMHIHEIAVMHGNYQWIKYNIEFRFGREYRAEWGLTGEVRARIPMRGILKGI